ncbi:MAG: 3-hydroxyacyl-ACP dehydratase FabZ [Planctomycetota bacterium]
MSATDSKLEPIHAAIPHRGPMLLVDEIVSREDDAIVCRKTFREDEFFFQGHYPENPLVPGVILCECAAQTGAILLSSKVDASEGVPVLTRMNDVKFKKMVHPGDTIEIHAKLDDVVSSAWYLTAQVKVGGKLSARLSLTCTLAPPKNG